MMSQRPAPDQSGARLQTVRSGGVRQVVGVVPGLVLRLGAHAALFLIGSNSAGRWLLELGDFLLAVRHRALAACRRFVVRPGPAGRVPDSPVDSVPAAADGLRDGAAGGRGSS